MRCDESGLRDSASVSLSHILVSRSKVPPHRSVTVLVSVYHKDACHSKGFHLEGTERQDTY